MSALTDIQDESRKITEQVIYGARLLEQKHKETLQVLEKALRQKAELKEQIKKLGEGNKNLQDQIEEWKKKYANKIYHNE